ncbi:MAG: hypothetical protein HDR14_16380 [Lachnospiraceae bacterium]|nr:hypothetical protein [Lachnospiraceae bacterium]
MTLQMRYQEKYEQGIEIGIRAMIIDGMEDGLDSAKIKSKLTRRFGLTPQKAEEYYDKYSLEELEDYEQ